MKRIFSSPNFVEVGLVQGLLEQANIEGEIRNDSASQVLGTAPPDAELWISNDEDEAEARSLIDNSAIVTSNEGELLAS